MAAWQALLLLAVAAAAAAALFLMKVRPPRVHVPSLLLWQRVLRPRARHDVVGARPARGIARRNDPDCRWRWRSR